MSTRYVWDEYEAVALRGQVKTVNEYVWSQNPSYAKAGKNYEIKKGTSRFYYDVTDSVPLKYATIDGIRYETDARTYPYCVQNMDVATSHILLENFAPRYGDNTEYRWGQKSNGRLGCRKYQRQGGLVVNEAFIDFNVYEGFVYKKGEYIERRTAAERGRYPSGADGILYYEYLGTDSIDPSSLSYSKTELQGGEPVTITVTPVTPTYGGTVSYQYSYSTNGGTSWTNAGSKTTDTTKTITVPNGVSQFQVRVQASDDMGFTSADYVLGQAMSVISMQAYVGIGNKARRIDKIYVGVNGKAREVVAGYVGVNGKARKFL